MSVHELDAIERAGEALSTAVDALDRTHLRALADRYDLGITSENVMRVSLKRRLVHAEGNVRGK